MDKAKKARIEAQLAKMIKENKALNAQTPATRTVMEARPTSGTAHVIRRRKGNPEERISIICAP